MGSLDSDEHAYVLDADSTDVVYSEGCLLFLRGRTLMAQPFNPDRVMVTRDAFPVAHGIRTLGALAYQAGTSEGGPPLAWVDRSGKTLVPVGDQALNKGVELSRDGKTAAVTRGGVQGLEDIWLLDLERNGNPRRFTFDGADDSRPIWSCDSSWTRPKSCS